MPFLSLLPLLPAEDDEDLTADEKALLRFQKQRLRELAGSKFALPDDDGGEGLGPEERLTHMGRSLEELDDLQEVRKAMKDTNHMPAAWQGVLGEGQQATTRPTVPR
jgi:hypothetical protein